MDKKEQLATAKNLQDLGDTLNTRLLNTGHKPHESELNRKLTMGLIKKYQKLVHEILKHN